ncbi:ShlB/FhaC/HecB family hemolysin secretion/activation protein [Morganella psychrotolerans]|uniref:ShlB/FhaC/HecB family hemolysin secretion/activation protein n=1 Tax=Morganella psychrotolerans TaxID=368603 RepID=A0A5M9R220_9GAMM|nr:ShlB/FhaC/HecB family hemolysin secretion/activation protein [Morganella psychrotolerans]KAA8714297.1 ShlB/FhaC/HecB family hemolysin secretion/activation protein [Morganella psychrotolerans]
MIKITAAAIVIAVSTCAWSTENSPSIPSAEPCATLSAVVIEQRELIIPSHLADEFEHKVTGTCLTSEQMAEAIMSLESGIHQAGFITALVGVPPQNVSDGILTLQYKPGYLSGYRDKDSGQSRFAMGLVFPQRADRQLNIRDTELGMNHLNQVAGLGVRAAVEPDPDKPGSSVIMISGQKKRSVSGSLEINNHGNRSTGSRQINNRLNIENPLQLYDRLFVYTLRDLDRRHATGTKFVYAQYRVPYQYWEFTAGGSYSEQKQQYPVLNDSLDYFTRSKMLDLSIGRKLLLTPIHDMTLSSGISAVTRSITLAGTPLKMPERRSVYWDLALNHRYYHPAFTFQYQVQYKHSLNQFGALPLSHMAIKPTRQLMAETTITVPFRAAGQAFYYEGVMRGIINADKTDQMDHVSLGDRNSVRGYPFHYSINAPRAFISRNEMVWQQALPYHNLYIAADIAVPGTDIISRAYSPRWLAGSEIGIKGHYKPVSYQLFTGIPFKAAENVAAFSAYAGVSVSFNY